MLTILRHFISGVRFSFCYADKINWIHRPCSTLNHIEVVLAVSHVMYDWFRNTLGLLIKKLKLDPRVSNPDMVLLTRASLIY